jgi:hypothetical protein
VGSLASVAALFGVGVLGELPLAPVLLSLSSLVGAAIARGSAYPGRFSIHVIGASVTVLVSLLALISSRLGTGKPARLC